MTRKQYFDLFKALQLRNSLVAEEISQKPWAKEFEQKMAEEDPCTLHILKKYKKEQTKK